MPKGTAETLNLQKASDSPCMPWWGVCARPSSHQASGHLETSENTNLLNVPREQIMKNYMKITQGEKDEGRGGGCWGGERERKRGGML